MKKMQIIFLLVLTICFGSLVACGSTPVEPSAVPSSPADDTQDSEPTKEPTKELTPSPTNTPTPSPTPGPTSTPTPSPIPEHTYFTRSGKMITFTFNPGEKFYFESGFNSFEEYMEYSLNDDLSCNASFEIVNQAEEGGFKICSFYYNYWRGLQIPGIYVQVAEDVYYVFDNFNEDIIADGFYIADIKIEDAPDGMALKPVTLPRDVVKDETNGVIYKQNRDTDTYTAHLCSAFGDVTIADEIKGMKVTSVIGESKPFIGGEISSVKLPKWIESIDIMAFAKIGHGDFTLPEGLRIVGEEAFSFSTYDNIYLPNTVETIQYYAFQGCLFKNFVVPEGVKEINGGAFGDCKNLESITLPESLETIGFDVFQFSDNLREATVKKGSYAEAYMKEHYPEVTLIYN